MSLPPFREGDPVAGADGTVHGDYRRRLNELRRLALIAVRRRVDGRAGDDRAFPAKITARTGNTAAWSEVNPGTTTVKTGGRSGTTTVNPAYEFNGFATPVGKVVELWPDGHGAYRYYYRGLTPPQNCQINLTLTGGLGYIAERTITTRLDGTVIHTGTTNFSGGLTIPIPTVGVEYEITIGVGSFCVPETILYTPPACNSFLNVPIRRSTPCPCCADDLPTTLYCAATEQIFNGGQEPNSNPFPLTWDNVANSWIVNAVTRQDPTWPRLIGQNILYWPAGSDTYFRDRLDNNLCKDTESIGHTVLLALHCPHEDPSNRWRLHMKWLGCPDDPGTITNQITFDEGPSSGQGSYGSGENNIHYTNLYAAGPPEGNLCGPVALSFTIDFGLFAGQVLNITQ